MRFDTKIAVVVRADLAVWQRLNMVAFLVSGIAATAESVTGEPYEDGSGRRYLSMLSAGADLWRERRRAAHCL